MYTCIESVLFITARMATAAFQWRMIVCALVNRGNDIASSNYVLNS